MEKNQMQCFARRTILVEGRKIEVRFAELDGRLECIGLEIGPRMNDNGHFTEVVESDLRPLSAAEMRFPFRRIVDVGLQAAVMDRVGTDDWEADQRAFAADIDKLNAARAEPRKRPGRPPSYGPEHFEKVARIYREHLKDGGRTPTKAVQEHFTVTKSTAAKWVARARELGNLEPIGEKK
jgi:hypothetical protein